ncbi:MAG: pyruvate ferredoxin oxidoreductase [Calditrichaeota bacterium]|nr:pyruvate ferredoxin oxidoreductase [Calditrichota bacterium]
MRKVITGNHAVSYAVKLARVDVIAAYPITPQTSIVEELSEWCASGELKSEFIHTESEHSSMSSCIGASVAGARAFTATSSQGLAYMHEMLHWAAGGRLPIVMAEVNRSLAPPWTIYTDQQDSLSQRDTGWLQFYSRDNQEVLDSTILAFKIAEIVSLPAMVILDAFVLSHTSEAVDIPDQSLVDSFLPKRRAAYKVDTQNPCAFGGMKNVDSWMESRVHLQQAMDETAQIVEDETEKWFELTGRRLQPLQPYRMEDAEICILVAGTAAWTVTLAVDELRRRHIPAGSIGLWMFRPFPVVALRKLLANTKKLIVIDRSCSYGHSGIFAQECRSALFDMTPRPQVIGVIAGLGGREITSDGLVKQVEQLRMKYSAGLIEWMGVKNLA